MDSQIISKLFDRFLVSLIGVGIVAGAAFVGLLWLITSYL